MDGSRYMKRGKGGGGGEGGSVDVCLTEVTVKNLPANTAVSSLYSLQEEREETDAFAD